MKCEYCDNPVPNGTTRCPSCGAAMHFQETLKHDDMPNAMQMPMPRHEGSMQPPGQPQPTSSACNPYLFISKKSRIVYIILAAFFGAIGVHNFYAGFVGRGVVQLLITVLSLGTLFWISWTWAIVEICAVDSDGRGVPFD